ncbi:hypothetical protein J1N35_019002, partial [Gossypium stocksii]
CCRKKIAGALKLLPHIVVVAVTSLSLQGVCRSKSRPPCRFFFSPLHRNFSELLGKDTTSRKRTRSSKTTHENLIVINEEVKERFDSIFKHQPMILKKGFNLRSNDLMVVPVPIRKIIDAL